MSSESQRGISREEGVHVSLSLGARVSPRGFLHFYARKYKRVYTGGYATYFRNYYVYTEGNNFLFYFKRGAHVFE